MSTSDSLWSNKNQDSYHPLTRSTTTHGRHTSSPHIYLKSTLKPDWTESNTSYIDMLTEENEDWIDSYRLNQPVRKTKSMRETKEKKSSMPFMHKIKRKLSLTDAKPRRSVSSSVLHQKPAPVPVPPVPSLAEYQGYARQTRHRSFTYSPPPPPRTSSLASSSVPAVPPLPPPPKLEALTTRNAFKSHELPTRSSSLSRKSNLTRHPSTSTAAYAKSISDDLAQIEKDIRALEIQRDKHSSLVIAAEKKVKEQQQGRKRGKTLPGSLATPPPPPPTLALPPMLLNPIQLNLPNKQKKPIPRQSTSTITPSTKTRLKLSALNSTPPPPLPPSSSSSDILFQPNESKKHTSRTHETPKEGARSPKSVQTSLKYYGQYLSDYERQLEIHDFAHIYFVGPHAQTKHGSLSSESNHGFDDDRGDYRVVLQDHLAYRYEVLSVLGRGSFGQVVKCFDHKKADYVAVKLIRNKKRFHAQAMTEINILKKLIEWDPQDQCHMIRMTGHFYFRNHLCIAFECLSMNLYEFIKSNHFQGFSLSLIKRITLQLLESLTLLAQHHVIHCDLKPENIMLKHPAKTWIKMIDFGSSCFESERVYTYIQSRFYRSPEVILGLSYHKAIDMWSVGCIVAELYTGMPLFPGENEQEQLSCIMEIMGLPDRRLIERCSRRHVFFDPMGHPRLVPNSRGKKRLVGTRSLQQALGCHDTVFIDFVARCLCWDPSKRMSPQEALNHAYLKS